MTLQNGFFTGVNAADNDAKFEALRAMAEANFGVRIARAKETRAEFWRSAETAFGAPLGSETRAFLGFIADIEASGTFETLAGDKGKMKASEPCQYDLVLTDLNDLDPAYAGLGYMKTLSSDTYFSILASDQSMSPCATTPYQYRRTKGTPELSRGLYGDTSLISFALRFFGIRFTEQTRALSSCATDDAALVEEARSCFGNPAELGGGVFFYEAENTTLLVRPIADIGITLTINDFSKPSPVSAKLLTLIEGGPETFEQ